MHEVGVASSNFTFVLNFTKFVQFVQIWKRGHTHTHTHTHTHLVIT